MSEAPPIGQQLPRRRFRTTLQPPQALPIMAIRRFPVKKLGRALEVFVQSLVISTFIFSWYIVTLQIGVAWLMKERGLVLTGGLYILTMNGLLGFLAALYVHLCSGRRKRDIPRYPMPDITTLQEPYECINTNGELAVCHKDNCEGAWKPPRTHHCSTCRVCRLEDHHCPWLGNCVTTARMKPFLLLMYLTPLAFAIGISPIGSIMVNQISEALKVSQNDDWARRIWWDAYVSWVIFVGPIGRWVVGTLLGYHLLELARGTPPTSVKDHSTGVLVIVFFALFVSMFTLVIAIPTTKNVLKGQTTLDAMRDKPSSPEFHFTTLICIPIPRRNSSESSTTSQSGAEQAILSHRVTHGTGENVDLDVSVQSPRPPFTHAVEYGKRLYDLGYRENWKRMWMQPIFGYTPPSLYTWPKINPDIIDESKEA